MSWGIYDLLGPYPDDDPPAETQLERQVADDVAADHEARIDAQVIEGSGGGVPAGLLGSEPRVEISVPPSHCKTEVPGRIPTWAISIPRGGRVTFDRDDEIDAVLEQVGVPRPWRSSLPASGDPWADLARFADVLSRPGYRPHGEFTEDDSVRLRLLLENDGRGA